MPRINSTLLFQQKQIARTLRLLDDFHSTLLSTLTAIGLDDIVVDLAFYMWLHHFIVFSVKPLAVQMNGPVGRRLLAVSFHLLLGLQRIHSGADHSLLQMRSTAA